MKKRLLSVLLMCCMVLTLLPTTAFAEESTETPPVCTCETACAVETMNAECSVCGAEGASAENCAKYIKPADDAAVQPEGEVSDPQPETALTALIGGSETVTEVNTVDELTAAIAGVNFDTVKLAANISISRSLTVNRPDVTLDLNGYTLTCGDTECDDIFSVNVTGNLTVKDSGTGGKIDGQNNNCGFSINGGILTLKSGTIINCMTDGDGGAVDISDGGKFEMSGGAITNCKASDDSGAVDIGDGCTFIMNSGTISGCRADDDAGAIFIKGNASFVMNGGTIENCSAGNNGGAVKMRNTSRFTMNGGTISSCTAQQGGGVYVDGGSTFTMNGGSIANYTAVNGGNSVFVVKPSASFTMTGGTVDGSITMPYTVGNNTVYMDGLGTAAYPYQISTADQLKLFRDIVNGTGGQALNRGACAILTADIDLNNEPWTPIGKYTNDSNKTPYTGTFDGKHYAIKGLYVVNLPDLVVGLFGCLEGAAVRNLTVDGYVQGCDFVSGIAGDASANSTIENCRNDCHVVSKYGADSGSFLYVGGIVGSAADTTIAGCVNTGVVEARGSNNFGSVAAGIVGILYGNATVINCYNTGEINVTGDKLREGTAGGIAGKDLSAHNTVSDCYNVGAVTVEYTGNSDSYIAMVGGIMGKIHYSDTTVSNCYSVGTLKSTTGTGTSYIGGVVGITNGTVGNCYYLDSTTTKAVGSVGGTVDEATGPKTAAQLGDGTVLALLINNRGDSEHPWNSQCQYLAAARKTLPAFKTQTGDEHTHDWSAWTSNGDGTHSRHCTCNAVETENCSGGTATCTAKAVCTVCGAEYGELDAKNHADLKHVPAKAATRTAEGNIEYWHCEACEKYFSDADAKNEITQAQTVIPKRQSSGSNYSYYTIKATAGTGGAISPSGNVSVRGGRDQTFTITPDQGYAVSDVKIDGESVGAVTSYSFENVRKAHTIAVSFATIKIFVDVPVGSYYEDAVDWAVENGITKGTDDTHFSPDGICTRAQAVTFLWRAAGSPEPKTSTMPFTDVNAGSYYYDAVLWAVENGITKGTSDTTFSPNATCTRAQIVAFLWRSEKSPAAGTANPFTDVKSDAYYADAVLWAVKENITKGTTSTTFSPDADCTRAQIVTFLWRCKK